MSPSWARFFWSSSHYVGSQSDAHRLARGLRGKQLGARSLCGIAQPAPQVDLVGNVGGYPGVVALRIEARRQRRRAALRQARAVAVRAGGDVGQLLGGSRAERRARFIHAREREHHARVVGERFLDQAVEHRIAVHLPPRTVRREQAVSRRVAPRFRKIDRGPGVVGIQTRAGAEQRGQTESGNCEFMHGRPPR